MNEIILNGLITVSSSVICSTITWFLARKKYHSEVDHNLIQNMQDSLEFYKNLSDDNKERLDEMIKRNDALEEEVREVKDTMFKLMANLCYDLTCSHRVRQALFDNTQPKFTTNSSNKK